MTPILRRVIEVDTLVRAAVTAGSDQERRLFQRALVILLEQAQGTRTALDAFTLARRELTQAALLTLQTAHKDVTLVIGGPPGL